MRRALAPISLLLALLAAANADASPCGDDTKTKRVLVKGKTPIRRGPGLNYPVSSFVDEGRCMKVNEVSVDGQWVLVQDAGSKVFGWVPIKQVDAESQAELSTAQPTEGPVGSGQTRTETVTTRTTKLLKLPKKGARAKKVLPAGSPVVALAVTEDGKWLEVRDDRLEVGWVRASVVKIEPQVLASLPRSDVGLVTGMNLKEDPSVATSTTTVIATPGGGGGDDDDLEGGFGFGVEVLVLGVAAAPVQTLDSNGVGGNRRYTISAFAAGAQLGAQITNMGPIGLRLSYAFVMMGGLAPDGRPETAIGAQMHDARVLANFPIALGDEDGPLLVPELGYAFALFSTKPALKGDLVPTFISSQTHGLDFGVGLLWPISEAFSLDLGVGGLLGVTSESLDLGSEGITAQGRAGVGGKIGLSDNLSLLVRWDGRYRQAPFSGPAALDNTITTATLKHLENTFSAGLALRL